MLIDWITARLPESFFTPEEWANLMTDTDRIMKYNPKTGEQHWESCAWESIRSDSHQLSFKVGSDAVWLQGSPARVIGDGCNVFSSGAASKLDLIGCVQRMSSFLFDNFGLKPRGSAHDWIVSRIDVTGNLLLDSADAVRIALDVLKELKGGKYKVNAKNTSTVYLGGNSRLTRSKIYAKGQHLRYLNKKKSYEGRIYSEYEIEKADRLLRLELTLGAQLLREKRIDNKSWWELSSGDLYEYWNDYFQKMIGDSEIMDTNHLQDKVFETAPTPGQARAAMGTWALIQQNGFVAAQSMHTTSTWYRNLKILRQAGLSDTDFSMGQIVPFRRKIFECQLVESWQELLAA